MINLQLHITLPGEPPIKKNNMRKKWFKFVNGRKIPLSKPYLYYDDKYVKWGRVAVQHLAVAKTNYLKDKKDIFPLRMPLVITFLFFTKSTRAKDISNLLEAPQDLLVGDLGFALPKKFNLEKKSLYQIIADDNYAVLTNHGGTRVFLSSKPRIEIYIDVFSEDKWKQVCKIWHGFVPDVYGTEGEQQELFSEETNVKLTLGDLL